MSEPLQADRIYIAVSSCLLGELVRYDGGHKANETIKRLTGEQFTFIPVCPEVATGMGIPRAPIQLVKQSGLVRAVGVIDPSTDFTDRLHDYAATVQKQHSVISGYIFKQRSPSCGLGQTVLYNQQGEDIGLADGIFAGAITQLKPDLPVIDEERISDKMLREKFLQEVLVYHRRFQPVVE